MLTTKEILKVAELAKIKLSDKEIQFLFKDINDILDYVKKIHNYNISEKNKCNIRHETNLRKDEIIEFDNKFLTDQFSEKKDNLLRVRKVF